MGKANHGDGEKISGWERKRGAGKAQRKFRAVKLLCRILSWWEHVIIHVSQPRMNSNANDGLWVIIMCPCRFVTVVKNVPLWCWLLKVEERLNVHGDRGIRGLYILFCSIML